MSDHWEIYLSKTNDSIASVRLDVGIHSNAPLHGADTLVILKTQTKSFFSKKMDYNLLAKVEDDFDSELTEKDFYVGVITTGVTRTFYIYTMQKEPLLNRLESSLSKYRKLKYDISIGQDPDWTLYLDTLYPNGVENQWIKDRHVVEQLKANNDSLHTPREIKHWLYFIDQESRDAFKRRLSPNVYRVEEENTLQDDSSFPYQLILSHTSAVEHEIINRFTTELFKKATEVGGDYDGWETPVVKAK